LCWVRVEIVNCDVERGESSPTAAVLHRLAAGLGTTLASLFAEDEQTNASPVSRRAEQVVWRDPETGYLRRNLSPGAFGSLIELVEVVILPGVRVPYDTAPRTVEVSRQVWVLEGAVDIAIGADTTHLAAGDCLAMQVDRPTAFRNPGREPVRYLVALTTDQARLGSRPVHHRQNLASLAMPSAAPSWRAGA
jgi:transcriptional regulator with XRE-family HTH domain